MDIARIIKRKGYTQQQVADILSINRVNLNNMINGNPTCKTMRQIADAIGANVSDFFEDEQQDKRNDFAAFIRYKGIHYTADTIEEFAKIADEVLGYAKD